MNWTTPVSRNAAARHRCSWCYELINPGERYMKYRYFSSGDAATVKMHPECHEAMLQAADEEGGSIEWTPGQDRPRQPQKGRD